MYKVHITSASDWMDDPKVVLRPTDDVIGAVDRLCEAGAPAAPVVDADGHLVGLLTEKDCLRYLSVSAFHVPRGGTVADQMSEIRFRADPSMDLFRVAELFLDNNFPMLPVVDNGRLCGQITRLQVLRGIHSLRNELSAEIARQESAAGGPAESPSSIEALQNVFKQLSRDQLVRLLGRGK